MRPYAERPARLARQLLADLLAVAWVAALVWAGDIARQALLQLRVPATGLTTAGTTIGDTFASAARTAARVPFVGDELAAGLDRGRAAGTSLAEAGQQQYETVTTLATGTMALVILLGALPLLVLWLPLRVRYARSAAAAVACREQDAGLLALRALTRVPVRRLRAVAPDPVAGWRRGDPDVVRGLAACELRRLGLRAPR